MSRRLIYSVTSEHLFGTTPERTAKVYKDVEWSEYRVVHYLRGVRQAEANYHTPDKAEAIDHADSYAKTAPAQQVGPVPTSINVVLEVTDTLCKDLLTTAVEGGSAYWLACDSYTRDADLNVLTITGCVDNDDRDTKFGDVDLNTMRLGIARILGGKVLVRSDIRQGLLSAVIDPDSCEWDADSADCVLQAGLLNAIVYG